MIKPAVKVKPFITLVGPPNSGKTTLFNYISGSNNKTVNYPGSTVSYSLINVKLDDREAVLLDSPGIISLIPNSPDELVAIDALYSHSKFGTPDLVIATVDASQLSRHLLVVKQMIRAGFTVIVALTMNDILERKGFLIDTHSLEIELGCKVCKIDGKTGNGINDLLRRGSKWINEITNETKVERHDLNETTETLLEIFDEIEGIEERVLLKITDVKNNVQAANYKLKINNTSESRSLDNISLQIDRIVLHKYWGLLVFFLSMSLLFTSIFWLALPLMDLVDESFAALSSIAGSFITTTWLSDLVADGLISGLGSVVIFLPQIVILFFLLGLLEDSGYLARGAMLIDKPLSKIGLNGRSFVPMLSGFACAIPAMMAARTIPNKRERLLTIFILPLMSCSARLPVYALLIGFLLPIDQAWLGGLLLAGIYLFSVLSSSLVAGIINKFSKKVLRADDSSSFILELPTYKVPKLRAVINNTTQSSWSYLKKAGPVILAFSAVLWFLTYFPNTSPEVQAAGLTPDQVEEQVAIERVATSYASELGKFIQPVMEPIGMDWRVGVSLISAFAAREVFVSSLALIFKVTGEALQASLLSSMRNATFKDSDQKIFTPATVIGLIVFFVFALQCLSTVAVAKQETGGWRIPLIQLGAYTVIAYGLMFITVNGLRFLGIS